MIKEFSPKDTSASILPYALNTLTLERNAVLVARVSKDAGYDFDELQILRQALDNAFPNHPILILYDDIDFMSIEDKGYKAERITINDFTNYY